jgi:hypothetical protein
VYVEVPPVTLPEITYSVAFGQLLPDWVNEMETAVVPPLGLQVTSPLPVANVDEAPLADLSALFFGVHFEMVKLPEADPLSFLHATGVAAPAGEAESVTAVTVTGRATALRAANPMKTRRMFLSSL